MNSLQVMVQPIQESILPNQLLQMYYQIEKEHNFAKKWKRLDEQQIWKELCFCLLSGNVAYELVKSTIECLEQKGFLDFAWILEEKQSQDFIFKLFNGPNFEPRKKNGELRKYRYPKKRSGEITKAAKIIYSESSIKQILENMNSDVDARNHLAETVPGLGIKESSHFLRNIGYSNSLAIIDVHVLNFLKQNQFVIWENNSSLTTKRYCKLETTLKNLSEFHDLDLAIFDLAIWHYMRNNMS